MALLTRLFCFFFLVPAVVHSQNFTIKTFTTEDGLPGNYTFAAMQDSKGYLWVGTINGITKFNGREFSNFGEELNLPSLSVRKIFEDSRGNIWAGAETGVVKIDRRGGIKYPMGDSMRVGFTFDIAETPDQQVWWLTDQGVYQFDGSRWVNKRELYVINRPVRQVIFGNRGTYLNYGDQIIAATAEDTTRLTLPDQWYFPFFRIMRQCNNRDFVSTNYSIYEMKDNQLRPLFQNDFNERKGKFIFWYYLDSKNRWWFASDDGLWVSRPGEETLDQRLQLPHNLVSGIIEDDSGNIWVLSAYGLVRVSDDISHGVSLPAGFNLMAAYRTSTNRILIANAEDTQGNGGLYLFDGKRVQKPPYHEQLKHELIDAFAADEQDGFWISTRSTKLLKVERDRITSLNVNGSLGWIPDIAFSPKEKTLYIASHYLMLYKNETLLPFSTDIKQPNSIFIDSRNNKWIGTSEGKIFRIDGRGSFTQMNKNLGVKATASAGRTIFREDKPGNFWIAIPGAGIRRYSRVDDELRLTYSITTETGLPNAFVSAMEIDRNNCLWVITHSGPVFINPNEKYEFGYLRITNLTHSLVGEHKNWSQGSIVRTSDDKIIIATTNRIYTFSPDDMSGNIHAPTTVVTDAVIANNGRRSDLDLLDTTAELNSSQNDIIFSYHGVALSDPEIFYSYQLVGHDTAWSVPSKSASVSFVNLDPGKYSFRVKSKLPDSDWGAPATVDFIIHPPIYDTWWFRTAVFICCFAITILSLRWYSNRIKAQQAISRQIVELELRALKSQMNPHFIFNAMNSIQALIANDKPAEALKYTSKFSKLLRLVLENSERNFISLDKEITALELYIQIEALRLNFSLDYEIVIDKSISPDNEDIPPLVIQPYVENALWHGLSTKSGARKLRIYFTATEDVLTCEVVDNGIGREQARKVNANKINTSKGHALTQNRLSLINQFDNIPSVEIIDLYEDGTPSGTKVIIKINRKPLEFPLHTNRDPSKSHAS